MKINESFRPVLESDEPIIVLEGGTSSAKTYTALQFFLLSACQTQDIFTVTARDIPSLKEDAYRHAKTIVATEKAIKNYVVKHNLSSRSFKFASGSTMEFDSYKDEEDARGGKRGWLYVNEANRVPYEVFETLNARTSKKTIIDFNPTRRFWAHEKLQGRDDVLWHHSTFKDNAMLDPGVKKKILAYEPTPENIERGTANEWYWKAFGVGEIPALEGVVYDGWELVSRDDWPESPKRTAYGLDFGFSNSPSAVVEVAITSGGQLFVREHLYETGLTNQDLAERLKVINPENDLIIADSAEPKSIRELQDAGLWVQPSTKGRDSVWHGIQNVKQHKIRVDSLSKNLIHELESYIWGKDRGGNLLNKPVKSFDHLLDSLRYATVYMSDNEGSSFVPIEYTRI